jgi:serine/threonine-protein kinase
MGSVYEVEHEITKHRRALKLMHPDFALRAEHVARFLREASAAGRIGNPHIAETFDAGKLESGEPYIVMELLEGQPLNDLIEARGQLGFAEAISFTLQAAEGVEAAHKAGIVHRDLKPENVFVCAGRAPFVKILDFGISKFDPEKTGDSRLTVDGTTMGTPTHMSPEQIRGRSDIDGRTDVYALGLVLYESVTGTKAYNAETLTQLAVMIHEGRYAPVSQFRADVPAGFEQVIARALDAERDTRYQTMREFMDALASFLDFGAAQSLARAEAFGARATSAPPTLATQPLASAGAATDAGVENSHPGTQTPRNKTRNVALAMFAVLVVLGLGAVLQARLRAAPTEPTLALGSEVALQPSAEASSEPVVSVVPVAAPSHVVTPSSAAPLDSASGPGPKTPVTSSSKPGVTPRVAGAASATPAVEKTKPPKTRAGNVGLAEENPF